jgi:hypothetical protein
MPPVISSAPAPSLGKAERESLHVLWKAASAITEKVRPCWCKTHPFPHRTGSKSGANQCQEKTPKAKEEANVKG